MHMQFEDLLSEAEAEAVVDRCRNFGKFERSQAFSTTPYEATPLLHPLAAPHTPCSATPLTLLAGGRPDLNGAHLDTVLVR